MVPWSRALPPAAARPGTSHPSPPTRAPSAEALVTERILGPYPTGRGKGQLLGSLPETGQFASSDVPFRRFSIDVGMHAKSRRKKRLDLISPAIWLLCDTEDTIGDGSLARG